MAEYRRLTRYAVKADPHYPVLSVYPEGVINFPDVLIGLPEELVDELDQAEKRWAEAQEAILDHIRISQRLPQAWGL